MEAGLISLWMLLAMGMGQTGGIALAGMNPVLGMTGAIYSGPTLIAMAALAFTVRAKSAPPVAIAVPVVPPVPPPMPAPRPARAPKSHPK